MTDDVPGRFLLIEDKASDAELLSYALQEGYPDYPVEIARSAEEGLEKAARPGLALILTDYKLPRLTGLEILPELRRLAPDAGLILLTGHGDEKVAVAAMREGADYFLRKTEGLALELPLVVREVLEKRRLAKALRRTEQWLWTIMENAPDAIFVKDAQGRYLLANPAARHVLSPQNPAPDAVIGKTDAELVGPATAEEFTRTDLLAFGAREPVRGREMEVTPWGARTWESVKVPVFDAQGRVQGLIGISRNITEQLRMEAQACHAEKIQAIGHLVAGVAHELNNPLTGIIGHTELSLRETQDPVVRETLDIVFTQARRAAKIVRNLLAFARPQSRHREMVSLSALVQDVLKTEGQRLKAERIAVELDCPEGVPPVLADPSQIEGVLTNLVTNARQAMVDAHGGGRLLVRVGYCRCGQAKEKGAGTVSAAETAPAPLLPDLGQSGSWVELEVVDDGPGIPADVHDTIFTPFFTTKPVGQGTGLGLSLVHSIIKEHGGTIGVRSVPGGGADFVIHLPGTEMPEEKGSGTGSEEKGSGTVSAAETVPDPLSFDEDTKSRGQVLIIDDEPPIRKFLNVVLEQEGFAVTPCAHGAEGLAAIERAVLPPRLIFLDFRMPVMDGAQFLARLEALRPDLVSRVIFCTGDALNPDVQAFLSHYRNVVLAKPFDRETLLAAIRAALGNQE